MICTVSEAVQTFAIFGIVVAIAWLIMGIVSEFMK